MRIGIYQSYWGGLGGGGVYVGAMASALARDHDVEIVHHRPDFERSAYERALDVDLQRVNFRFLPVPERAPPSGSPWRRYQVERDLGADISRPYDLFINSCETVPSFCHAPRGVLLSWFPFVSRDDFHGRNDEAWTKKPAWRRWTERQWHDFEWRRRFATYQQSITISKFSQKWLEAVWGLRPDVVYPPMTRRLEPLPKERLVVSVSRFQASQAGHHKKHRELIETFLELEKDSLAGWRYVILGGLHPRAEDVAYFDSIRALTAGTAVSLEANATGETVKSHLERSSLFWHGTGFGEDSQATPARMEHFGIATVEAMAAGSVPVVFNGGGQPEIVTHRKNGFLWKTLGDLQQGSKLLATDESLRRELAIAARQRAADFSFEKFRGRLLEVLRPALSDVRSA